MTPLFINIEQSTNKNKNYREVVYTDKHSQVVLMSLLPKEEIGMEKHKNITQFIRVEKGTGIAIINDMDYLLESGTAITVPSNTYHNIINTGKSKMQLYTVYCGGATHPPELIEKNKI
jgi:mannose-6-phosphate isomerase-like protein (cupin superfamily)